MAAAAILVAAIAGGALAASPAVRPQAPRGPSPDPVADALARGLARARSARGVPGLARRPLLDRAARSRAEAIAALPEAERLQYPVSVETSLREAGVRRFRWARAHLDLQENAPDPAAAALAWWRQYASAWEEAMDPRMDAVGVGTATAADGWRVLVTILLEDDELPADLAPLERAAEQAVNRERAAHGLPPLAPSDPARQLARSHSRDMAVRRYFDHRSPEGDDVAGRAASRGVAFRKIAENISRVQGMDDPVAAAVAGWMGSPGHRANILDPELTEAGVGIAVDEDGMLYLTQVFLRPAELP